MQNRLTDEQIRRFICDGFLIVQVDLPDSFHAGVAEKLRYSTEKEFPMGNNILPRIPEMYQVLDAPPVVGALTSLLGAGYLLHPHRAVHSSTPVEHENIELTPAIDAPAMGKGSMAGSGWHQDAQSPLARARYHVPRYLILFYFPHDTDIQMGPTRLEAGSYLFSHPEKPVYPIVPDFVAGGTVFIVHFDLVHAGFSNRSEQTRYVVKFVASRTRNPDRLPSPPQWSTPDGIHARYPLEPAWSHVWRWLHGLAHQPIMPSSACEFVQVKRLNRIYSTVPDERQIGKLTDELASLKGSNRHRRELHTTKSGKRIPKDLPTTNPRWNERAIVMEDTTYALALAGDEAVEPLCRLFSLDDPWISINACYALGEIGNSRAIPTLVEALKNSQQQVVRQALDALGVLGYPINDALQEIERLVTIGNDNWLEPQVMRGWTAQDQVRLNAAFTLLNVIHLEGSDHHAIERILIHSLDDPNGYVTGVACEALRRINTPSAMTAAFAYLQRHRWDSSLVGGQKIY
ncbi:MAG: HEAT repeat domain-containing protein [Gammaproteobacteria bacterium]|nr:HEAT repeat domain-containing protein [Gammaproteobacteria bacterium]